MRSRLPKHANRFKRRLLAWFRRHGRDLPWRGTRDPYRVLVSEFMLQQTRVSRVTEYYPKFLYRFPTLDALAGAKPREVREAWDGLGYYRRAANLHRLAQTVVREHGGSVPPEVHRLRELPGVGRYTAGAVACFAFERRSAAVDTNVARVLARVFPAGRRRAGRTIRRSAAATSRRIWDLAARLLPRNPATAWEFNQALMDLGASFCKARSPNCRSCPVRPACATGSGR